jgi:hypothetical protein
MINNGVTRATRIHYLAPGQLVTVEITDRRPKANFFSASQSSRRAAALLGDGYGRSRENPDRAAGD